MRPISTRRRVTARSWGEGLGSPEGWLWASSTIAAPVCTAGRKTARGSTMVLASLPRLSRWTDRPAAAGPAGRHGALRPARGPGGLQQPGGVCRPAQDHPGRQHRAGRPMSGLECGVQAHGAGRPHPGHLGEGGHRAVEDAHQPAKALQQVAGDGRGRPLSRAGAQDQGQQVGITQPFGSNHRVVFACAHSASAEHTCKLRADTISVACGKAPAKPGRQSTGIRQGFGRASAGQGARLRRSRSREVADLDQEDPIGPREERG